MAEIEVRHLRDLTPPEVARALRALSSTYVERRARLSGRGAFDTVGKRAAYALYYAPRRFLMVRHVLTSLAADARPRRVCDPGCGTGAAGAAWATYGSSEAQVVALDVHPWAVDETRATLAAFGLRGDVRRGALDRAGGLLPDGRDRAGIALGAADALILSYIVNELDESVRDRLLPVVLDAAARGTRVLVVEPISRRTSPWWPRWTEAVVAAGGRADEWRASPVLPDVTRRLGRAAGLDVTSSTARTLWL
jgi:predicted nicotinamide N-methyase